VSNEGWDQWFGVAARSRWGRVTAVSPTEPAPRPVYGAGVSTSGPGSTRRLAAGWLPVPGSPC